MSCEITPGARPRRHVTAVLLALLGALLVAAPAHAAPARVAKCAACASHAADVNRLAAAAEQRQRDVVAAKAAVDAAKTAHDAAKEQVRQIEAAATTAMVSGAGLDAAAYNKARSERVSQEAADYLAYELARGRHAAAMEAESKALAELARATGQLNACEEKNCPDPAGGAPQAAVGQLPAAIPIPPGSKLSPRPPLCPFCAESARRRNELVDIVNQAEAVMQAMRNAVADAQNRLDTLATDIRTVRDLVQGADMRQGQLQARHDLSHFQRESYRARLNELQARLPRVESERNRLADNLRVATATHTTLYNEFLFRDAILNACERQFCQRPQAGVPPTTTINDPVWTSPPPTVAPVSNAEGTRGQLTGQQPQSPAPPPPTGDRRTSRVEVQIFGGGNVGVSRLNLTGVDDFFGPGNELIDRRSSSTTKFAPALGAFARVKLGDTDAPAPRDRFFVTAGMIFTPGRGNLGFDASGINAVPQGFARLETTRDFLAPIMVGYQMQFMAGRVPFNVEVMAGIAIGHETTRLTLLSEGGAPGGPGASGENSGFYVDPIIGFAVNAPIASIAGLGTVNFGVMGLAAIGTGGRSVRVPSPNFGSQVYTGEHKRQVEFFLGATLTFGLF